MGLLSPKLLKMFQVVPSAAGRLRRLRHPPSIRAKLTQTAGLIAMYILFSMSPRVTGLMIAHDGKARE